ncbi:MAG TPA: hypothetical protein DCR93_34090 [Cytophagales bacterium]|nr:hypothetical protein [Cytophagales bacterium]HAP64302.1 hypothetical protein [Cytophagales bacterium]
MLEFIEYKFGLSVARQYAKRIENTLNALSSFPNLGTLQDPPRGIRGLVVKKHTSIFYIPHEGHLLILNVFDNRMDPDVQG